MVWNWQLPDWPQFVYDSSLLASLENRFLQEAGGTFAIFKHLDDNDKKNFIVELLCTEGMESSEIEGELLQRESLQFSIQRHFGLITDKHRILPKEEGMANLMCTVYDTYNQPLSHETLYEWHRLLFNRSNTEGYRSHEEPMQIVSRRYDRERVYFEAPRSKEVFKEMTAFIDWFNSFKEEKSVLARAAVAHLYFESIHPFEDGNGRIGRALVEKLLSQGLQRPTLIAVSHIIAKRKKEYYAALDACNRTLCVDKWVSFFGEVIVQSQDEALRLIHFLMAKCTLMSSLVNKINERQEKALLRMFAEGPVGFKGGLSAENYIRITKTSRATASRDLADLVEKGALRKTGRLKQTRYWLNID